MTEPRTSMEPDEFRKESEKPASLGSVDTAVLIEFAERKQDIADRMAKAKRDDKKLRADEAAILAMLTHAGVAKMTVKTKNGDRTLGFRRNVYSSVKDGVEIAAVIAVLDELDLEDFYKETLTLPSINAWLKEQYEAKVPIPDPLIAVLNTDPSYRVGVTKS